MANQAHSSYPSIISSTTSEDSTARIVKPSFRSSTFGGYRKDDVSEYLTDVKNEWESLVQHNEELENRVAYLEKELDKIKDIEKTLLQSLSQAQNANRLSWEQAQKNADLKILEGKQQADALVANAKAESKRILHETQRVVDHSIGEIKREAKLVQYAYEHSFKRKKDLVDELRSFMESAIKELNNLSTLDIEHGSEKALERAEQIHQHHSHLIREALLKIDNPDHQSTQSPYEKEIKTEPSYEFISVSNPQEGKVPTHKKDPYSHGQKLEEAYYSQKEIHPPKSIPSTAPIYKEEIKFIPKEPIQETIKHSPTPTTPNLVQTSTPTPIPSPTGTTKKSATQNITQHHAKSTPTHHTIEKPSSRGFIFDVNDLQG